MLEAKSIVSQSTKVVPEHLFIQIPKQVEGFDADICALQLALEQTPKVFESVGVNLSVNVSFRVVDNLMLESLGLESLIGHERICVDRAPRFDVSANVSLQRVLFAIADYGGANFTATFQNAHDGGFVFGASLSNPALVFIGVHESGRATNESFVHFDRSTGAAKFQERAILHCKTNAMEHEPCRLLSDAKSAAHFIGTDTVLAVGDHPNSDQPLVEGKRGVLKDGAHLNGELPMRVNALALPLALILKEHGILALTSGAGYDTIRPAQLDHEFQAVVRVGEMNDGLLERLGLFHCFDLKQRYPRRSDLSSILLPLQKNPQGGGFSRNCANHSQTFD